jgi:hypothetical protein
MGKFLIWFVISLVLLLVNFVPVASAENAGKVEKNIYTDSRFGFQVTALDNWKVKSEKESSLSRVVMTQKNYKTSNMAGASKSSSAVPTILILADTTSLSLKQVEESLLGKGDFLSKKNEFMIKLDLIPNSEYAEINDITVDSIPSRDYTLKQPYKKTGEDLRVHDSMYGTSVIIQDYLTGHVVMFKKENNIFVIQFTSEREFFYPNEAEFQRILNSWKFTKP